MKKIEGPEKGIDMSTLIKKAGGVFKFTTLMQKRLREINAGDRTLVDMESRDQLALVAEEFRQGKISLIQVDADEDGTSVNSSDFADD